MKKSIIQIICYFCLVICGILLVNTGHAQNRMPINSIIGDISFTEKYGTSPTAVADEDLRIQTHLEFAENLLRKADVSSLSPEELKSRSHLLDLLNEYREAGIFPRNYDYHDRRPCFIDKDGRICAVGYLVEQTVGRKVASDINDKFKYDHVLEMNDAVVDSWISESGLSKLELATIQPDYGGWGGWSLCDFGESYVCRISNCIEECKCVKNNLVEKWILQAKPCKDGNNGNGNGNGGGNGNGNGMAANIYSLNIHPNPASSMTTISFSLDKADKIAVRIFDINARLVKNLNDGVLQPGIHHLDWNAADIQPGLYLLTISSGNQVRTEKINVMR